MKFNQKIYLIPAAKYERLISEKQKSPSHLTSDHTQTSSFTSNDNTQNIPEVIKTTSENKKEVEKTEDSKTLPASTHSVENPEKKVGEYSQKFTIKTAKQQNFQKDSHSEKLHKSEKHLFFPPPGIPEKVGKANKRKIIAKANSHFPKEKTEIPQEKIVKKQKLTPSSKKLGWVTLK